MHQDQPLSGVKIIKLVNGEDVVTILPTGKNQLPDNSQLVRLEKPLLIKYVPQMTLTGFKDYIALIKWCFYTPDKIITIPKILEDRRRCFWKNNRAGNPKNFVKYATIKNLIPRPTREININPIMFIAAMPLVTVMILYGSGVNAPKKIISIPFSL